jgi:UDP-3-O-[3-hydroxymyristoyl] glucosamine N-acyltransferase
MSLSLQSLAASLDLNFEGDPESIVQGVGSLSSSTTNDLCFILNEKYTESLADSNCSTTIVPLNFVSTKIDKKFLFSASPQFSFTQALHLLEPQLTDLSLTSIHASAQISDSAKFGAGVSIGALVVIRTMQLLERARPSALALGWLCTKTDGTKCRKPVLSY